MKDVRGGMKRLAQEEGMSLFLLHIQPCDALCVCVCVCICVTEREKRITSANQKKTSEKLSKDNKKSQASVELEGRLSECFYYSMQNICVGVCV